MPKEHVRPCLEDKVRIQLQQRGFTEEDIDLIIELTAEHLEEGDLGILAFMLGCFSAETGRDLHKLLFHHQQTNKPIRHKTGH